MYVLRCRGVAKLADISFLAGASRTIMTGEVSEDDQDAYGSDQKHCGELCSRSSNDLPFGANRSHS